MNKKLKLLGLVLVYSIVACMLLLLLLGCQSTQLPRLLTQLNLNTVSAYYPRHILTKKDGTAYLFAELYYSDPTKAEERNVIVKMKGTEVQKVIRWPNTYPKEFDLNVTMQTDTERIYMTSHDADAVRVLDGDEFAPHISNVFLPGSIVANPINHYIYAINVYHNKNFQTGLYVRPGSVSIISNTTVITQLLADLPTVVQVDPIRGYTYIGEDNYYTGGALPFLKVLTGTKTITYTALDSIYGGRVQDIEIDEDSGDVYLLDKDDLVYWDREQEITRVGIGCVYDLVLDSTRDLAYVSGCGNPNISVVQKDKILAQFHTGTYSYHLARDRVHDLVYVPSVEGTLSILRGTELLTTTTIGGYGTYYMGIEENEGYLYLANTDTSNLFIFGFADSGVEKTFWEFLPFIGKQ